MLRRSKVFLITSLLFCQSSNANFVLPPPNAKYIVIAPWRDGFFAGFLAVLNHLGWCKNNDRIPIVDWGPGSLYYQKEPFNGVTSNAWEYYFEPVSDVALDRNYYRSYEFYLGNPAFHFNGQNQETRNLAYSLIREYIKIKPWVQKKIDDFYQEHMAGKKTIGIHMRGTDKYKEETPITVENIVAIALEHADADTQFLIASDEQSLLDKMTFLLQGHNVITYKCHRSCDGRPIHYYSRHKAQNGEDVLIEVLLLARCDLFVHSRSNVSTAALYFNPTLEHIAVKAE